MRCGEASEAENLFSPDRFRQSRDDRRAIIFAFREFRKIAIRKFFENEKPKIARKRIARMENWKSENARDDRGESNGAFWVASTLGQDRRQGSRIRA
jgi:hypothetical protein